MSSELNEVLVASGPGVEVTRHITHHGFFYGHFDGELEEVAIPPTDAFDPASLTWPAAAVLLRVMHRIVRVRRIWGEDFPGEEEAVKSRRVYLCPGAEVVTSRKDIPRFKRQLRDLDGAERLLRLGNVAGIVAVPDKKIWGKLRLGERVGGRA
jgi:hypothetical protein